MLGRESWAHSEERAITFTAITTSKFCESETLVTMQKLWMEEKGETCMRRKTHNLSNKILHLTISYEPENATLLKTTTELEDKGW